MLPTTETIVAQTKRQAAGLLPGIHRVLSRQFQDALWAGLPDRREIALTFDDGPHEHDTPQLLEVLARHQVQATFFSVGEKVEAHPHLVRAMAAAGHQIAIHGYRHRHFPLESEQTLRGQLAYTQSLIARTSGYDASLVRDVRPPYGTFTPGTLRSLTMWGYRPVMWSVVPIHWLQPAEATVAQVMQQTCAGSLIVLHESLSGPPVAALADTIISALKTAQFRFITVDQMWRLLE
jgi:peptidoglycan/xylan/chitin deacetylase (PgdA/CDA1 family)